MFGATEVNIFLITFLEINRTNLDMSHPTRKPTLWTLRKLSTRISLSMPRRLSRTDTFRLLSFFYFKNH